VTLENTHSNKCAYGTAILRAYLVIWLFYRLSTGFKTTPGSKALNGSEGKAEHVSRQQSGEEEPSEDLLTSHSPRL